MKGKTFICTAVMVLTIALCLGGAQPVMAVSSSQINVYNTIYGTSYTGAQIDALLLPFDEIWVEYNGGVQAEAKFAGYSQYFGYYTDIGTGDELTYLFEGITTGGYLSGISATLDPNVPFGFFTDPNGPSGAPAPFFSETELNGDDFDHFLVYTTPVDGELVIFTEDLFGGGDQDFVDFVVSVHGAAPIPEPATLLLVGAGLVGLAGARRKMKK